MCGIAGAIGFIDDRVLDAVTRMNAAQQHRGPNASGCVHLHINETAGAGVVLAHRRLSIIDLCNHANQPMRDDETGNVIIYNGEVYNYPQLRAELEAAGATFQTNSDTEVVLKAYGKWGEHCAGRLRGMFAMAIWDAATQRLILMRDRQGIKPLYYARIGDGDRKTMLIASELRALLDSGMVNRQLNPKALETYLWHGFVVGRETIINGVELLPAGAVASISAQDEWREREFWSLGGAKETDSTDTASLADTLRESVAMRLVSDVPLGVFLSGGVDSSAIAAMAVQASSTPVRTFNISFDESEYDESQYARTVAERLGTEHHELRLTQQMFRDGLQDALRSIDQPTFDAINTYYVSAAVREAGLTVALAGTGGDELFGGYSSFTDVPNARKWSRRLGGLPKPFRRALANAVIRLKCGSPGLVPPQTRWGKLHDVLDVRGDLLSLYQISYGLFTHDFLKQLHVGQNGITEYGLPKDTALQLRQAIKLVPELGAISRLELASFIGQRLLRDTDAASMAVSLEVRVPLLDHRVIEEVDKLDPAIRYHPLGRKDLLKKLAMPELDAALFDRPKAGFVLPIEQWARSALREQISETLTDRDLCSSVGLDSDCVSKLWQAFQDGSPGLYWSRIWAIFVLLWWCREHRVSL